MGESNAEGRLLAFEDREAIRRLTEEYCRHLDARDLKAYSELFADDGEWQGGTGYAKGPQAIHDLLEPRLGPNPPAPGSTSLHLISDPVIDLAGDRATGSMRWLVVVRGEQDVPEVKMLGHYEDNYVRTGGQWKFARRRAHPDIPHLTLDPLPGST